MVRRGLVVCASVFLLAGCRSATDANSQLELTLTTDRITLNPGDTAHLTLTLTNHSATSIRVPTPGCPHFFNVTDAAKRPAGPPQLICALILVGPTELVPSQSLTVHDTWAADSGRAWANRTMRILSGTYTLRGSLVGPEHSIASNAVAIRVND